jgi:hypothetical protein
VLLVSLLFGTKKFRVKVFTKLTTWALDRFDFSSSSSTYRTYYLLALESLDPKICGVNCPFKSI